MELMLVFLYCSVSLIIFFFFSSLCWAVEVRDEGGRMYMGTYCMDVSWSGRNDGTRTEWRTQTRHLLIPSRAVLILIL